MSIGVAQDMDTYKGLVPKLYFGLYICHVYPFLNNNNKDWYDSRGEKDRGTLLEKRWELLQKDIRLEPNKNMSKQPAHK